MTACVKNHSRRVALAISASLVGALSLGAAAPAVAFAESNEGIETQDVSDDTAFAKSKLVAAEDGKGHVVDVDSLKFVAGTGKYLVPTAILPEGATANFNLTEDNSCLQIFNAASDGVTPVGSALNSTQLANLPAGKYVAKVTVKASSPLYSRCIANFPFTVVNKSLDDAVAYNLIDGNTDTAKTTFTYNAEDQWGNIGFAIDGVSLVWNGGANAGRGDFNLEGIYLADNMTPVTSIYNAGNYVAKIVGVNDFAGTEAEIPFTINKLNLKDAVVWIDDTTSTTAPTVSDLHIAGVADANVPGIVKLSNFKAADGQSTYGANGAYSYTVSVIDYPPASAQVAQGNVEGETTVTFYKVDNVLTMSNFHYGNAALQSNYSIDLSVNAPFDASWINADNVDRSALVIKVYDVNGNEATVDDLKSTGNWTVYVKVDPSKTQNRYGSEMVKFTVDVTAGHVDANTSLVFTYKGNVVNSLNLTYSGEDFLKDIKAVLTFNGKPLTEGEDYTVTVRRDRKVVDSIVDAGNYTVTVSSSKWNVTGDKVLDVTVKKLALSDVYVGNDAMKVFGTTNYIAYTGDEIEGFFYYYKDADGNAVRLPEEAVNAKSYLYREEDATATKTVKDVKEKGVYRPVIADGDSDDNFTIASDNAANNFTVSSKGVFSDVPASFWGAEGIYDAYQLGYMSGYKGTTFFGPLDNLSRAQAAVVLYNMGTNRSVDETSNTWNTWFQTGLAFPDAEQWYAGELGWATDLGIVKGYPNGNFGGADNVNREQFAIMLRNYAAAKGEDVSVKDVDAALKDVKDANTIDDWAKEAVAWAVENNIMGAEGYVYANQPIQRAQAALMTTRYQPKALDKSDLLIDGVTRPGMRP